MILVNTTFALDPAILDEFTLWIEADFLPTAAAMAGATDCLLTRVLTPASEEAEETSLSYAVQFKVADLATAESWRDIFSQKMLREAALRWGHKVLQFTTLLEIVPLR